MTSRLVLMRDHILLLKMEWTFDTKADGKYFIFQDLPSIIVNQLLDLDFMFAKNNFQRTQSWP